MKKTILSLMLSASFLTASPLFAMEDPNNPSEPPHKTAIKQISPIDGNEEAKATKALQDLEALEFMNAIQEFMKAINWRSGRVAYEEGFHLGSNVGVGVAENSKPHPTVDVDPKIVERAMTLLKYYEDKRKH